MHPADVPPETGSPHADHDEAPDFALLRTRLAWVLVVVLIALVLVFIPPLISVSRFQRRIASNLSAALGRPVHLDRVTLSLVPLPGFTLENFVVDEDPAFGYEPILRANQVRATLRLSSLWTHHVEFSRISLTEPTSLNLVRLPDGRWNFESVLLQASRLEAAPTGQTFSGPAPRFPYIEASGARINFKHAQEKTPFALTDADFALWLPGPRQWRFRLAAHPVRSDVASSDSGLLRVQGTLGDAATRAATLGQVPIDIRATWDSAPLAGLGRILLGRDAGLRGDLTLDLHAIGSVAHSALTANIALAHLRRSEFIPSHLVQFQASCQAIADNQFSSFSGVECHSAEPAVLIATATIPDTGSIGSASASVTLPALPAPTLLDWLQAATAHPPALSGPGMLAGSLAWHASGQPALSGELELSGESLNLGSSTQPHPVPLGDVLLRSVAPAPAGPHPPRPARRKIPAPAPAVSAPAFELLPVSLNLGAHPPATLEGRFDRKGYTVRLTGPATLDRALALADAFPQLGDGLRSCLEPPAPVAPAAPSPPGATPNAIPGTIHGHPAGSSTTPPPSGATTPTTPPSKPPAEDGRATVLHLDLAATRTWGQPQTWTGCPAVHP